MPEGSKADPSLFGILLRFLFREAKEFAGAWLRMLHHPFRFFAATNPAEVETVYKALAFFVYSFAAQRVLWFFSLLPELPGAELAPAGYGSLAVFLSLFSSALVWHLLLRAVTHRAVPLRGTMALVLYNAGFIIVLIIPSFVLARAIGAFATRRLGADPALLFVLTLLPFVGFGVILLCRWMASYHGVRCIVAFLTFVVAEAVWQALQKYVVVPLILRPTFGVLLELYKRFFLWMVGIAAWP